MNSAFPKLFAIGTGYIADLFDQPVEITEKIDGSQFGFGKSKAGELFVRSKGKLQNIDAPDKMFALGAEYVKTIADKIPNGYTFYGEYLQKPKHSTLAYDRTPTNYIALFGVKMDNDIFVPAFGVVQEWAKILGIDSVPLLYSGKVDSADELLKYLETPSYLGGQKIEGIVAKRYEPWMFASMIIPIKGGKFVSEAFKEVHGTNWTSDNTVKGGFEKLKAMYRSEARWNKAVQHLEDDGLLTKTPSDIGPLLKEIKSDISIECKEDIKNQLWQLYGDDILRYASNGLPQWYKEKLMKDSMPNETNL